MKNARKFNSGVELSQIQRGNRLIRPELTVLLLPLIISGCATEAEFLAQNSPAAVAGALGRGRSELSCPNATAKLLSQNLTYVHEAGIGLRGDGTEFTEHTIGVEGCGKQAVYEALCEGKDACKIYLRSGRTFGAQ